VSPRVLIIDDNPVNLKLARVVLAAGGFDVRTAEDAEAALAMLESFAPQVILMDVQLPGMDGLALTRRLKGDPVTRPITVIAMTAYAMKGDEQRMLQAGCDGYIAKPIDTRTLAGEVAQYATREGERGAMKMRA